MAAKPSSKYPPLPSTGQTPAMETSHTATANTRAPSPEELASLFRIEEGKLVLEVPNGVVLQCGGAKVELTKTGGLYLNGKFIAAVSEGPQRLRGSVIELN